MAESQDPVEYLETQLSSRFNRLGPQRAIDFGAISGLVSMFLGLFNSCRNTSGSVKALESVKNPGRREHRIAQRLVLRDHFNADRREYRRQDGDSIAAEVLSTASSLPQEKIVAAADAYREESTILDDVD